MKLVFRNGNALNEKFTHWCVCISSKLTKAEYADGKVNELIEKNDKQCEIEILSDEKHLEMIDKKFDEELAEYHNIH